MSVFLPPLMHRWLEDFTSIDIILILFKIEVSVHKSPPSTLANVTPATSKEIITPKLARINPGVSERLDPSDRMTRAVAIFSNYGPPEKSVVI